MSASLLLTLIAEHKLMLMVLIVTVVIVTVVVVTVLTVMVLVVTVLVVTVLIVSNNWVQVLPVQCKMECSVSTLVVTSNLILNVVYGPYH